MSTRDNRQKSNLINQEEEDRKLWERLNIVFSPKFPVSLDNKIYGTIIIEPEKASKLIKDFALVVNNSAPASINCQLQEIVASDFDSTKEKSLSIHIEAIPKNGNLNPQKSEEQVLPIISQDFPLKPTLRFTWPEKTNSKPTLIVRWPSISIIVAQYVLCLDKKEIQYIRDTSKGNEYEVYIKSFQPGKRHDVQIKARLNNGVEIDRSDLITFTVPNIKDGNDKKIIEVPKETGTPDNSQKSTDDGGKNTKGKPEPDGRKGTILACRCQGPHEFFPGVKHYFIITGNEPSSFIPSKTSVQNKRTTPSNEKNTYDNDNDNDSQSEEEDHDDDDDVVFTDTES